MQDKMLGIKLRHILSLPMCTHALQIDLHTIWHKSPLAIDKSNQIRSFSCETLTYVMHIYLIVVRVLGMYITRELTYHCHQQ